MMPTTPPPQTPPQSVHLPPSLPNSPLAKRPKTMVAQTPPPSNLPNPPPPTPAAGLKTDASPGSASTSLSGPPLLIKKLSAEAKTPTRGSAFAAGYDLYSARAATIPARGKGLVETDLAIAVPDGTCEFFFFWFINFYFFPWGSRKAHAVRVASNNRNIMGTTKNPVKEFSLQTDHLFYLRRWTHSSPQRSRLQELHRHRRRCRRCRLQRPGQSPPLQPLWYRFWRSVWSTPFSRSFAYAHLNCKTNQRETIPRFLKWTENANLNALWNWCSETRRSRGATCSREGKPSSFFCLSFGEHNRHEKNSRGWPVTDLYAGCGRRGGPSGER